MRAAIHQYLLERPAGATARELLDLIFTQPGSDAEFGPHFIRTLLSGDPRFSFHDGEQRWLASVHAALSAPLARTAFCVVDLETTGGSPERGCAIIEIGAVRVDVNRRVECFGRLVNPRRPLPPFISRLTGITAAMLAAQPDIVDVLPDFLEFVGDRVLVAHNAPFDLAFLNAAMVNRFSRPLHQPHICTLRLARRLLPTLRRRGLDAVAAHFGIPLVDRHRALGDATVTTEIWLRFLDLLATRGIDRLDQVLALQTSARDGRTFVCSLPRAEVAALPEAPGVYRFFGEGERLLYIGKAKNLRQRVGQYLSNADGHSNKTLDLIRHIHAVRVEVAGSELEAALREADAIRTEQPPYNRLRKHLPRIAFIRLTDDPEFPRVLITARSPSARAHGQFFGPFRSRQAAQRVLDAVCRLFKLRTCVGRLRPESTVTACWRGQIEACTAPCAARITSAQYAEHVASFRSLLSGDTEVAARACATLQQQRETHAAALRFESAARAQRDIEQVQQLLRRQRMLGWVIARQHFLILQPSIRAGETLAYLVRSGRLLKRAAVSTGDDLKALVEPAGAATRLMPQGIDGTTILAAWMRDRGERDGFVLTIDEATEVTTSLPEWTAALVTLLATTPGNVNHRLDRSATAA